MNRSSEPSVFDRRDNLLAAISTNIESMPEPTLEIRGRLKRIVGLRLEVEGCEASVGSRCIVGDHPDEQVEAEVVGFIEDRLLLVADGNLDGLKPGALVQAKKSQQQIQVGDALIGRIIDGNGEPLDSGLPMRGLQPYPLRGERINPLTRQPVVQPLDVGVRCINSFLTIGQGQRVGLFAGSGVGKTTLLGMMTRNTEADVIVIGMIGERGKEVRDFIESTLTEEGLKRAVVVATPADDSALRRIRGAWLATAIAEYFRDQGKRVLLLMDSLSRFAQAQREIGLAIGEPPVTKGYTPSVFSLLPKLVERAGNGGSRGGSITAVYTVLTEGDDQLDPIADSARAILDGHIVLTRQQADAGIFPAIDIESSVSRAMNQIVSADQSALALKFKQLYSDYYRNKDLISIGAYQPGSNPKLDLAIQFIDDILALIKQDEMASANMTESIEQLQALGRLMEPANQPMQAEPIGDASNEQRNAQQQSLVEVNKRGFDR